jgi:hypothetical protein
MASTSAAALLEHVEPKRSHDAWEVATARFFEGLDDQEKANFNEVMTENILNDASNVQQEDQRESKTRALLERIQPLITAVGDYGRAMNSFANVSPSYISTFLGEH